MVSPKVRPPVSVAGALDILRLLRAGDFPDQTQLGALSHRGGIDGPGRGAPGA